MARLCLLAPAKINLALEVLYRRDDGFHEISTVVQTISIYDTLSVEPARSLQLVETLGCGPVANNLALVAAQRLRKARRLRAGARLRLFKTIPIAAGLGGGSSDAAAALRLLNRLWGSGQRVTDLQRLAAALGSDVPFFLKGVAAGAIGRGEVVQQVSPVSGYVVLVVPRWREPDKTARVYAAMSPGDFGTGERVSALTQAMTIGQRPGQELLVNGLQPAARRVFPRLAAFQEQLEAATAARFTLSGAGPALFHLAAARDEANRLARLAALPEASVHVAELLSSRPNIRARRKA